MRELNFAIIGAGRIGNRHAGHINKRGNLIAVCDIDKKKADALALEYDAQAFSPWKTCLLM